MSIAPASGSTRLGRDKETDEEVLIPWKSRREGLYIIGSTGMGKTTLIASLILQDIHQNKGVCLLDPHHDLTKAVIAQLPERKISKVILLDVLNEQYSFGLNLYQCDEPANSPKYRKCVTDTYEHIKHLFELLWGEGSARSLGPLISQGLRNSAYTLIDSSLEYGCGLLEIPLLFRERTAREKLVAHLRDETIRDYWNEYNKRDPNKKIEIAGTVVNKVEELAVNRLLRPIVGQSKTTINFREVMDEGKILLVKLPGEYEELTEILGAMIIAQLLGAAFSRKDVESERRSQFNIYADEFERFASRDFTRLLKETRKYGTATTIAHQARDFLDILNRAASAQVPNLMVFQISRKDADELAGQFDCTPPLGEPRREEILTPVSDVLGHLRGRGSHKDPAVNDFVNRYQLLGKLEYNFLFAKANRGFPFDQLIQTEEEKERLLQLLQREFFEVVRETLPLLPTYLKLQSERGMTYHAHYTGRIPEEQEVLQLVYFYLFIPNNRYILHADRYAFPGEQKQRQREQQNLLTTLLLHAGDPFGKEFKEVSQALESLARERFFAIRQEQALSSGSRTVDNNIISGEVNRLVEAQKPLIEQFIKDLYRVLRLLANDPIVSGSGAYQTVLGPQRPYQDVQHEVASRLASTGRYTAKVKMTTDDGVFEYLIKTENPDAFVDKNGKKSKKLEGQELTDRLEAIQQNNVQAGILRLWEDVDQEIKHRQGLLRQQGRGSSHDDYSPVRDF